MTRPMGEATTGQRTSEQAHAIRQLQRRPFVAATHWAFASFELTPQAAGSGGTLLTWEFFRTSDPGVFSTAATDGGPANNEPGDEAIRLSAAGLLMVTTWARWEAGTFWRRISSGAGGSDLDAISNRPPDIENSAGIGETSDNGEGYGGPSLAVSDEQWYVNSDATAAWFNAQANVGAAQPDKDVISASLTVVLFPHSGTAWADTEIY